MKSKRSERPKPHAMVRIIRCARCAVVSKITHRDERGEARATLWGFVALSYIRCDRCEQVLAKGDVAVAISYYGWPSEYEPWEGDFLAPLDRRGNGERAEEARATASGEAAEAKGGGFSATETGEAAVARGGKRSKDRVSAKEVESYVYCPEAWRLQYGLGHPPENQDAIEEGRRHHDQVAFAESASRKLIAAGTILFVLAGMLLAFALLQGSP